MSQNGEIILICIVLLCVAVENEGLRLPWRRQKSPSKPQNTNLLMGTESLPRRTRYPPQFGPKTLRPDQYEVEDWYRVIKDDATDGDLFFRQRRTGDEMDCPKKDDASSNSQLNSIIKLFMQVPQKVQRDALESRIVVNRAYAKPDAFRFDQLTRPPSMADMSSEVSPRQGMFSEWAWASGPYRGVVTLAAVGVFPHLEGFLNRFVTLEPDLLEKITGSLSAGTSVVYATFISLTLNILYQRQRDLQEIAAVECSKLTLLARYVLMVFDDDVVSCQQAAQAVADQICILVSSNRGQELVTSVYSDPYARLVELIAQYQDQMNPDSVALGLEGTCRDLLTELTDLRVKRLSTESLRLPSTHYLILSLLTLLILTGYCVNQLPTIDRMGGVPFESSVIFGLLTNIYVLFYNLSVDLNRPFSGIYRVRLSTTSSMLLEAKWLLTNHPIVGELIEFLGNTDGEDDAIVPDCLSSNRDVRIETPGLGTITFERMD